MKSATPFLQRKKALVTLLALSLCFHTSAIDLLVYNTNNAGAGSLRQAINDNNALGGGNTIVFSNSVVGTITLASELLISRDVTIQGPGANTLTVSGNNVTRVFRVTNSAHASFSGLTIARGRTTNDSPSFLAGGAVRGYSGTAISLDACAITEHTSTNSLLGAAIGTAGTLAVSHCLISSNRTDNGGGAIFVEDDYLVQYTTFVGNEAIPPGSSGGAITTGNFPTGLVHNCTFTGNRAAFGGAIGNAFNATLVVSNCTFAGNTGTTSGGGIYDNGGVLIVRNCIVASNSSPSGPDVRALGSLTSQGFNLIGDGAGVTGWGALGDQIGSAGSPLNPQLGPLQYNGGPTPTMRPLAGSPAIDQGHSGGAPIDQRGRGRRIDDPASANYAFGDLGDIGAVELGKSTLVVSNSNDSGPGSLRQAVLNASPTEEDLVTFAPNVTNTITLTSGQISLNKSVTILGPTASRLAVSGNNSNRVFQFTGGNSAIHSLNITRGRASDSGGGVALSVGSLQLYDCQVVSNATTTTFAQGGGIYVYGNASLSLVRSSVTHNEVPLSGGGIAQLDGSMVSIHSSTIASNRTLLPFDGIFGGVGAGIMLSGGTLTVRNSTIASNASSYVGGGIARDSFGSPVTDIGNTIIAGNTAVGSAPDTFGAFVSAGHNLIGNSSGGTGFTSTGDQLNVNPLLGPLANYGGPTLAMALRSGSPALDKGKSFGQITDQRGFPRPVDDVSVANASGGDGADIGAYEADPRFRIVDLQRNGNDVALSLMTVLGKNYRAESTNNLASGNWTIFTNNVPGNGYLLWVTNTGGANQSQRFYRGAVVP